MRINNKYMIVNVTNKGTRKRRYFNMENPQCMTKKP